MNRKFGLADKSILITGCSSGIGLYTAKKLQKRGYRVIATARTPDDISALKEKGIEAISLDYRDPESVVETSRLFFEMTGGKIFALINNGAYGQPGATEDLSREVLTEQFEANFFGWAQLTNLVIPAMRAQGFGRIIQISSVLGLVAMPYRGAYNASKFAIEGLSDTMRLELKGSGIKISLVEPGPITSRFRENSYKAFLKNIDRENSVHRERYDKMEERLKKEGAAVPFTLGPEAVYNSVLHAIESDRPAPRYYVTFPTYLFGFLRRVLPYRLLDIILGSKRVAG